MEFVDYAEEPVQVQIRVKGNFAAVRYESPEQGCCVPLEVVKNGEFTEFVIPSLQTAGRTYLKPAADRQARTHALKPAKFSTNAKAKLKAKSEPTWPHSLLRP